MPASEVVEEEEAAGARAEPAGLQGALLFLRPVCPADYAMLQAIELGGPLAARWRFRGATLSPEQWVQHFWHGVLAQHLVIERANGRPVGLVIVYNAVWQDGYARFAFIRFEASRSEPLMILGAALFLEHVFTCWPLRKLYMDVSEYNYAQFRSVTRAIARMEGRLRNHSFHAGRYWDQIVLAIDRDTWFTEGRRLVEAARPPGSRVIAVRVPGGDGR
jgi:RimJ/RimL family protein N-acetyltransferase